MQQRRSGRPSLKPKYNFAAHLDHLSIVLPHKRPENDALYAFCHPSMNHISRKQFMLHLTGQSNYHPGLPTLLEKLIDLSAYDLHAADWLNLEAFARKLKDATPDTGVPPGPPDRLRDFLDDWRRAAEMPELSLRPRHPSRKIGTEDPGVPRLHEGPHILRYRTPPFNGEPTYILLLEFNDHRHEWLCANRVRELNLDILKPHHHRGELPVPIMSAPGIFTLYAIAGPGSFGDDVVALGESPSIRHDGTMSREAVGAMLKHLKAECRQSRVVGRFRYRVA